MSRLQPLYIQRAEQDAEFLRKTLKAPASCLFVAEEKGALIGLTLVSEQKTSLYPCVVPHKYAYLMDLFVLPAFRGRGLGTQLIEQVESWAAARGLDYVELCVLAENRDAIRLYQRRQFHSCVHTMRLSLNRLNEEKENV